MRKFWENVKSVFVKPVAGTEVTGLLEAAKTLVINNKKLTPSERDQITVRIDYLITLIKTRRT